MNPVSPAPFAFTPTSEVIAPENVAAISEAVLSAAQKGQRVLVIGGGTAWDAGHRAFTADHVIISTAKLNEIIEYDPAELTITARAGTPLRDVQHLLAERNQYLPFDPPFAAAGATLGGMVAAGLTGSRRLRYGGLRDFILGVEFVNAAGQTVRGGGKVVKNAAGYDLPKLFCGSMGSLGVITEVSFKVFPKPPNHRTLAIGVSSAAYVAQIFEAAQRSPLEISAADAWIDLDNFPSVGRYSIAIQIEGMAASSDDRLSTLRQLLPIGASLQNIADDEQLWEELTDLSWIGDQETVLRFYLPPNRLPALDDLLARNGAKRAYSGAGNTAWAAFNGDPAQLADELAKIEVRAAVWRSPVPAPDILPADPGAVMAERVWRAFDPSDRFYRSPLLVRYMKI